MLLNGSSWQRGVSRIVRCRVAGSQLSGIASSRNAIRRVSLNGGSVASTQTTVAHQTVTNTERM